MVPQVLADMVHDQQIEKNVQEMQVELKALLQEVLMQMPGLKVEYAENQKLATLREQFEKQSKELEQLRSKSADQDNLLKKLQGGIAQSQKEKEDTRVENTQMIVGRDSNIEDLKKQLRETKETDAKGIGDLNAEIEALKKQLAAKISRGDKEATERNKLNAENEKLDAVVREKSTLIEELKTKLAATAQELADTKSALDLDESELQKDRALLIQDKQDLAAKDRKNDELEKSLAGMQMQITETREKAVSGLKTKDAIIVERDAEIEELKKRIFALEKEVRDVQSAVSTSGSRLVDLEAEVSRLKELRRKNEKQMTDARNNIKDNEAIITDLEQEITSLKGSFADLKKRAKSLESESKELSKKNSIAANERQQRNTALETCEIERDGANKQIAKLEKKVAKLEADIALGAQVCSAMCVFVCVGLRWCV